MGQKINKSKKEKNSQVFNSKVNKMKIPEQK